MDIFGIGFGEMLMLVVIGLVVVGPDKLPEMARKAGKALAVVKAQTSEMRNMLNLDEIPSQIPGAKAANNVIKLSNLYDGKTSTPFDRIMAVVSPEQQAAKAGNEATSVQSTVEVIAPVATQTSTRVTAAITD